MTFRANQAGLRRSSVNVAMISIPGKSVAASDWRFPVKITGVIELPDEARMASNKFRR
jgi:hypothetical protein